MALMACKACGSWATSQPVGLLEECRGSPTGAGKAALKQFAKGFHPISREPLAAMWSLAQASRLCFEASEEAGDRGPEGAGRVPAGSTLKPRGGPSAGQRMEALRARVLARAALP